MKGDWLETVRSVVPCPPSEDKHFNCVLFCCIWPWLRRIFSRGGLLVASVVVSNLSLLACVPIFGGGILPSTRFFLHLGALGPPGSQTCLVWWPHWPVGHENHRQVGSALGLIFCYVNSCFVTQPASSIHHGTKKGKIRESSPDEIPSNEHDASSTLASAPPSLLLEAAPFASLLEGYANHLSELSQPEANRPSSTTAQNIATSGAWQVLLPKLVYPLMEQQQARMGRDVSRSEPPTTARCSCSQRDAQVLVVSFTCMYHPLQPITMVSMSPLPAITPLTIQYCRCTHPAIALIRQGAFTTTPVNPPKWAFNLQYLAFIREQFLAGVPNYSAWCNGAVAFLTKDGCQQVPSAVSKGTNSPCTAGVTHSCSSQLLLGLYPLVYSIIS